MSCKDPSRRSDLADVIGRMKTQKNQVHTYLIVSLIMWVHREINGFLTELEMLPVVLQCKTKGLPAAWSMYTPKELTAISNSG